MNTQTAWRVPDGCSSLAPLHKQRLSGALDTASIQFWNDGELEHGLSKGFKWRSWTILRPMIEKMALQASSCVRLQSCLRAAFDALARLRTIRLCSRPVNACARFETLRITLSPLILFEAAGHEPNALNDTHGTCICATETFSRSVASCKTEAMKR